MLVSLPVPWKPISRQVFASKRGGCRSVELRAPFVLSAVDTSCDGTALFAYHGASPGTAGAAASRETCEAACAARPGCKFFVWDCKVGDLVQTPTDDYN